MNPKINIIRLNCDGNYETQLVTFDHERARAKYAELMKKTVQPFAIINETSAKPDEITGFRVVDDGDQSYVEIENHWYEMRDSMGDLQVIWEVEEVV